MQKLPILSHLTGFRAIAAYLVMFGHSVDSAFFYAGSSFYHEYVAFFAYLGMSLFFVLSGFVITYSYYNLFIEKGWLRATLHFAIARFARLYPLYIVFILINFYIIQVLLRAGPWELLSHLTLTQSWWNMQSYVFAPAWSISTECFFYLAFALSMGLITWRKCTPSKHRLRLYMFVFYIIFPVLLFIIFTHRDVLVAALFPMLDHVNNHDIWAWVQYFSPYVRIGEFIAGAFSARLFMLSAMQSSPQNQRKSIVFCFMSIVIIIGLGTYNITHFGYNNFLFFLSTNFGYAPFIAYLLYACSRYPNVLSRFCSQRWMIAGGTISYSVYLLQFPVYALLKHSIVQASWSEPSTPEFLLLSCKTLMFMITTTIIAYFSYRLIEKPARQWIRRCLG